MQTTDRLTDAVGSRRLKMALLAAAALAVVVPSLAHAGSVLVPGPEYSNFVRADQPPPPGCDTACTTYQIDFDSTALRTGGISISALSNSYGDSYEAATDNNYTIPSVYASARATGELRAGAGSELKYYFEFESSVVSTVSQRVEAYGQATAAADDGAGPPDSSSAGATATISIYNNSTQSSLMFKQVSSGLLANVGTQTLSIDQNVTFATNTLYFAVLNVEASAAFDHSATAFADPYFDLSDLPDGVTFLESAGIGNSLPGATPLPAALPLFATGLGALGLLGWRRKKAAVT